MANPGANSYAEYIAAETAELGRFEWRRQTAYAAACAERLYPAYRQYRDRSGSDPDNLVRRALDLAWAAVASGEKPGDVAELVYACQRLIPDADDDWDIPTYSDDAIAAAVYAAQAAAGIEPRAAEWAASRGLDTLYGLSSPVVTSSLADNLSDFWHQALVQAEVARRLRDRARLSSGEWLDQLDALRRDAMSASVLPLDTLRGDSNSHDPVT